MEAPKANARSLEPPPAPQACCPLQKSRPRNRRVPMFSRINSKKALKSNDRGLLCSGVTSPGTRTSSRRETNIVLDSILPNNYSSVKGQKNHSSLHPLREITRPFSSTGDGATGGTTDMRHDRMGRLPCPYLPLCPRALPTSRPRVRLSRHRQTRIWKYRRLLTAWRSRLRGGTSEDTPCIPRTRHLSCRPHLDRRTW